MLSRLLRQFLFTVIHWVVSILVAVQNVYQQLWVNKCNLFQSEVTVSEIKLILKHMPKMNKKLNHLVLLADTDQHSLGDLARVVIWSLVAGVPYVSFHDITGELKQNEEKLFREVERNKKGVPGFIKWPGMANLNGYSNGGQVHTVVINIFTSYDGRPTIAQCIKQVAEETIPCEQDSSELTAQEFHKILLPFYCSIPDPELVLYSGNLCCTYGLLPWQTRLTEFVQLSMDYHVNVDSYIGALYKYNKCDQRFGK